MPEHTYARLHFARRVLEFLMNEQVDTDDNSKSSAWYHVLFVIVTVERKIITVKDRVSNGLRRSSQRALQCIERKSGFFPKTRKLLFQTQNSNLEGKERPERGVGRSR